MTTFLRLSVLFIFFVFSSKTFSQEIKIGDVITLNNSVPVKSGPIGIYSGNSIDLTTKAEYLKAYLKYKVIDITDDEVSLMALKFGTQSKSIRDKEAKEFPNKIYLSDIYNDKIYIIKKKYFNSFAVKVETKDRFSIGLLTLPFKARPQGDVTFDTEFNLNSSLNIRLFEIAGSSLNYQMGAGIGSVGLNTSNAEGLAEDEAQDVATLTLLNGLMIQFKKVQFGLYAGVDHINNQKNYKWESNGNLWLGFGIGYNLFNISLSKTKDKDSQ